MALVTAGFMGFYAPLSLCLLSATTLAVYLFVGRKQPDTIAVIVATAIIGTLLAFFKLRTTHSGGDLLIPLGLSYYAFRQIHYVFEAYKNKLSKKSLANLVYYLYFLPTLIVGPIHRYQPFIRDLGRRRWDTGKFSGGLERILFGYLKVTVLAFYLVKIKISVERLEGGGFLQAYLNSVVSWADLYLQFSGYSDIAIGVAALAGFEIMENFKFPFLAKNINDFWSRWHISLTSWCREYVFQPTVSFSRKPLLSVALTMVILGLWHEISLRYILWGAYHAIGIALWHQFQKLKPELQQTVPAFLELPGRVVSVLITLNFVILSYPVTMYVQNLIWRS
jgi:alginate O-acetyltransferase complex protein AlgI